MPNVLSPHSGFVANISRSRSPNTRFCGDKFRRQLQEVCACGWINTVRCLYIVQHCREGMIQDAWADTANASIDLIGEHHQVGARSLWRVGGVKNSGFHPQLNIGKPQMGMFKRFGNVLIDTLDSFRRFVIEIFESFRRFVALRLGATRACRTALRTAFRSFRKLLILSKSVCDLVPGGLRTDKDVTRGPYSRIILECAHR